MAAQSSLTGASHEGPEYGPGGCFGVAKRGTVQHRFKVDMHGAPLWPLCYADPRSLRYFQFDPSPYIPKCKPCECRYHEAGWLPMGERPL